MLTACGRNEKSVEAASDSHDKQAPVANTVELTVEEADKLGVTTSVVAARNFTAEQGGYGVVMSHESIAQLVAEVSAAEAAVHQSQAALTRAQKLANTPGAFPAETLETAERQAAADNAAFVLAQRKLTASLGQQFALQGKHANTLAALASGELKLLRVSFPLGANDALPQQLRITRLGQRAAKQSWTSTSLWNAPADTTMPGRSYFAAIKTNDLAEGERVQVWAPAGAVQVGVVIPSSAVVVNQGRYWCYLAQQNNTFIRVALDISQPTDDGYFVRDNIKAGDAIVTTGASLLLARELNPSAEAE